MGTASHSQLFTDLGDVDVRGRKRSQMDRVVLDVETRHFLGRLLDRGQDSRAGLASAAAHAFEFGIVDRGGIVVVWIGRHDISISLRC